MKNNKKLLGILIITLFGLIPLLWFKKGLMIAGGDEYWLLDPSAFTNFFKYAWNIKLCNAGGLNLSMPQLVPIMHFWTFFKSIGLSLLTIEKLWIILLFLLPGLSMYYLVSVIYNKEWAKIIASTLYMFNLFIVVAGPFQSNIKPVLIALPLMLTFWIKGLNNKEGSFFKYSVLIGLCSLIYAGSNVNLPSVAVVPIILFLYWVFHIINQRKEFLRSLKFVLATIGCYFFLNLWWIVNFLANVTQQASAIKEAATFRALGGGGGGVMDFFRLLGCWAFRSGHYKMSYYPYAHFYDESFLLVLSFSIPLLVFAAIFLKPKNKNICFFSLLAVIGLFLAKGTAAPFGFFYKWAFENIPGFWVFREPFAKFTPITLFSYSVLLGFSVELIYQKVKNWHRLKKAKYGLFLSNLMPVLIIIIILTVSFPLLTGEVIWNHWNGSMRSLYVKVPNYWHQTKEWLDKNDKDARVFQTPKGGYGVAYNWEHGFSTGDAPAVVLLANPILRFMSFPISHSDRIVNSIYDFFNPNQRFILILRLLNTKYILQQNDIDWKFAHKNTYSPVQMKKTLFSQQGINFIKSFGKLDLYKISDEYFLPHIYASTTSTIINGDIETLVSLTETKYLDGKPVILFTGQDKARGKGKVEVEAKNRSERKEEEPEIIFKKINPTKYLVKVKGAKNPFWLVFSESFHEQWGLYNKDEGKRIKGKEESLFGEIVADYPKLKVKEAKHLMKFTPKDIKYLFKEPLDVEHHLVNGYANGWYVEPKKLGLEEDFTLVMYFWPQTLFYLGLGISGATLLGCIGYLLWPKKKRTPGKNSWG